MKLNIFPSPRIVTTSKVRLNLESGRWIVLPKSCGNALADRARECTARIQTALNKPVSIAAAVSSGAPVLLAISINPKLSAQGYKLILAKDGCTLQAGNEAGAFYGLLAFTQIVEQFGTTPPALTISDAPDFPSRGIMLDVSRCRVPTMATLKQLIDRLAGIRINQIQLYIEHTFAFAEHKTVWHDASPFAHEEILELDEYCKDRFIELVPNFNSFGHFERWLRHPEYRHLAECPDNKNPGCLAPNRASLTFLEELYDEYLPHFSSTMFNVGCDETWELGTGRSKKKAEKTSTTTVYLEFLKKIHTLVTKKGRRMQFWGDIILHQPELIKELPKDIVALCWGYDKGHPYDKECRAFADSGVEFYVCPGTSAWNSITGRTDNCLINLESAASNGLKYGATGFLNTDWGDGGHHQTLPISYLGFSAGAAYSWNLKSNKKADLAGAISRHFFQDPTGLSGQFCIDLGRTLNKIPGLLRRNSSCINLLLFSDISKLDVSKVTRTQYTRALAWLDNREDDLRNVRLGSEDAELVIKELTHALSMSRFAIHRGQYMQFGIGSPDQLRRELQGLIMSHEEQWLARNRRGGLHESSRRLRNVGISLEE